MAPRAVCHNFSLVCDKPPRDAHIYDDSSMITFSVLICSRACTQTRTSGSRSSSSCIQHHTSNKCHYKWDTVSLLYISWTTQYVMNGIIGTASYDEKFKSHFIHPFLLSLFFSLSTLHKTTESHEPRIFFPSDHCSETATNTHISTYFR